MLWFVKKETLHMSSFYIVFLPNVKLVFYSERVRTFPVFLDTVVLLSFSTLHSLT